MKPGTIRFTAASEGVTAQLLYTPRSQVVICTRPAGADTTCEFGSIDVSAVDQLAAVSQVLRFFLDWYREGSE